MPHALSGRTALVTGSTSGIGRAIALAFAEQGAHVVVSGRRADAGAEVVAQIVDAGGSAVFVGADLAATPERITAFAEEARAAAGGRLDILVNNAAYLIGATPTVDTGAKTVDAALEVNIRAPFLLTAAVAPAMIAAGGGAIINVGSINGVTGMAGAALYGATKAALHSLTKSWAAEFGRFGIRVNTLAPGPTETEWNERHRHLLDAIAAAVPSGRISRGAEVAAAAVFLASDAASHVHGTTLTVDGGMAAVWPRPA